MLDEDVLDRALPVHELEECNVGGLEAEVEPRAVIAARVLQYDVWRAVAPAEVGALDVRDRAGDERGVLDARADRLVDAVHQAFARATANAGTGREKPFSSSSPMGPVSMRSSTAALSRWDTRIWPASARAESRCARIVTFPMAA